MGAGLAGTGRAADEVYLLAHSDVTGKPLVQPRALGLGLAGGLLAELVLAGAAGVGSGAVVATGRPPPGDGLARHVLSLVAAEREPRPVGEWLVYLARTAPAGVARRLEGCGYLAWAGGRGRWRGGRWVPVDPDAAFGPLLRVRAAVDVARPPCVYDVVVAGLAEACGLGFHLAQYLPADTGRTVAEAAALLHPTLRGLIACTRTAVDSAVLAHRA